MKIIANNRKAFHDYHIEDRYEAGIVLTGTEIKSIRKGAVQLKESYVYVQDSEVFISGMHISPYHQGNQFNHEPMRDRKLLLHKREIARLDSRVNIQGYTIVPTRLYLKNGMAKLEIALAKGKDVRDKREAIKERDAKREIERSLKNY